jgi:hypothetical protein
MILEQDLKKTADVLEEIVFGFFNSWPSTSYIPSVAAVDFHLFVQIKESMEGQNFEQCN